MTAIGEELPNSGLETDKEKERTKPKLKKILLGALIATIGIGGTVGLIKQEEKRQLAEIATSQELLTSRVEAYIKDPADLLGEKHVIEYGSETTPIADTLTLLKCETGTTVYANKMDEEFSEYVGRTEALNTKTVGTTYIQYNLYAQDEYGQTASNAYNVTYEIKDTKKPIIKFDTDADSGWIYTDQSFDVDGLVKSVKDPVDGALEKADELTEGTYTVTTSYKSGVSAGNYDIKVEAMDINGNKSEKTYTLTVKDRPVIIQKQTSNYSSGSSSYSSGSSYSSSSSGGTTTASYSTDNGVAGSTYVGDISVNGFWARCYTDNGYNAQAICDAASSAWAYNCGGMWIIGDHASQGFQAFMSASTLTFAGRTYTKVAQFSGAVEGSQVYLETGENMFYAGYGSLCTYTCTDNSGHRCIAYWN